MSSPALERHYSIDEISKLWGLSGRTLKRMFDGEAGVLVWGSRETRNRRGYHTIRVPESVLTRIHSRLRLD